MLAYPPRPCEFCGERLDVHGAARGHCGRPACTASALKQHMDRREAARRAQELSVAEAHRDALLRQQPALADAGLSVLVVPGFDPSFLPVDDSRRATLREHVEELLSASPPPGDEAMAAPFAEAIASTLATEDASRIGAAACAACQGHCCRKAGDSAYLRAETIARVRAQFPGLADADIAAVYREAIPVEGANGSCIFHGHRGCTLRREFRADICNTYFCEPVARLLDAAPVDAVLAVVVEDLQVKRVALARRRAEQA